MPSKTHFGSKGSPASVRRSGRISFKVIGFSGHKDTDAIFEILTVTNDILHYKSQRTFVTSANVIVGCVRTRIPGDQAGRLGLYFEIGTSDKLRLRLGEIYVAFGTDFKPSLPTSDLDHIRLAAVMLESEYNQQMGIGKSADLPAGNSPVTERGSRIIELPPIHVDLRPDERSEIEKKGKQRLNDPRFQIRRMTGTPVGALA